MLYGNKNVKLEISLDLLDLMNNIQFVDVSLIGFDLTNHKLKVPEELLELAEIVNKYSKFTTSYNLFDPGDDIVKNARIISKSVVDLRKKYTITSGPYGRIILLKQKQDFERELEFIKDSINDFKDNNLKYVADAFNRTIEEIYNYLLPFILRSENSHKFKDDEAIFKYVDEVIRRDLNNLEWYFSFAGLSVIYSNVAVENLDDDRFRALLYRNNKIREALVNTSIYKKLEFEGDYLETLDINSWRGDWSKPTIRLGNDKI